MCDSTNAGHGHALAASRDTAASSNATECLRTSRRSMTHGIDLHHVFCLGHTHNGQVSDITPPDGRLHLLLKHWTAINPQIRNSPQVPQ